LCRFILFWIDFGIKVLFHNELIELFIGLIAFILVLDKILTIRDLDLNDLSRQFIANDSCKCLDDHIELFIESCDVEPTEFQGKIVEAQLGLFKMSNLFLLSLRFAAIEEGDDETA
jgi:hypothetical protein